MKDIVIKLPLFYKLFKRIYKEPLEKELRDILGYWDFVGTESEYGHKQSMSWETFIKDLFQ